MITSVVSKKKNGIILYTKDAAFFARTSVVSKNPELFFSLKMQRVLQERLMTIRF